MVAKKENAKEAIQELEIAQAIRAELESREKAAKLRELEASQVKE